jgi:hypothetical protein
MLYEHRFWVVSGDKSLKQRDFLSPLGFGCIFGRKSRH